MTLNDELEFVSIGHFDRRRKCSGKTTTIAKLGKRFCDEANRFSLAQQTLPRAAVDNFKFG